MSKNQHASDRVKTDRTSPPSGHDKMTDDSHALRAPRDGATQRKSQLDRDPSTRDEGSDDRRSGSESGKS